MTESCARPGCGHEADAHQGDGCIHLPNEGGDPECACPGYRTAEQQVAWSFAADAIKPFQTRERMRVAIGRLLGAYP